MNKLLKVESYHRIYKKISQMTAKNLCKSIKIKLCNSREFLLLYCAGIPFERFTKHRIDINFCPNIVILCNVSPFFIE